MKPSSQGEPAKPEHQCVYKTTDAAIMVLAFFLVLLAPPTLSPAIFTPVQKYVALEKQKMMLFEYGQPFKLHKRSRAELYKATAGH
ncbi:MAG: hypothetical protein RL659_361 [Pseudomonadota bacterium]